MMSLLMGIAILLLAYLLLLCHLILKSLSQLIEIVIREIWPVDAPDRILDKLAIIFIATLINLPLIIEPGGPS